jgi:hypothetical protein
MSSQARQAETQSAERLQMFLSAQGHNVRFESVHPDPPDFLFIVDGIKWAVEHTQLHLYVFDGVNEVSLAQLHPQAECVNRFETTCCRV